MGLGFLIGFLIIAALYVYRRTHSPARRLARLEETAEALFGRVRGTELAALGHELSVDDVNRMRYWYLCLKQKYRHDPQQLAQLGKDLVEYAHSLNEHATALHLWKMEGQLENHLNLKLPDVAWHGRAREIEDAFAASLGKEYQRGLGVAREKEKRQLEARLEGEDELVPEAETFVRKVGKASPALLQRHFWISYARAAYLLDGLEKRGVIEPVEPFGWRLVKTPSYDEMLEMNEAAFRKWTILRSEKPHREKFLEKMREHEARTHSFANTARGAPYEQAALDVFSKAKGAEITHYLDRLTKLVAGDHSEFGPGAQRMAERAGIVRKEPRDIVQRIIFAKATSDYVRLGDKRLDAPASNAVRSGHTK